MYNNIRYREDNAYRECRLSLSHIARRTDRHPSTATGMWNQWVVEDHAEWHIGSQCPPIFNARKDRHIVKSALQNPIATSWTISHELNMFTARSVSTRTVCRRLQQRGLSARQPLLWLPLTMQHRERRRLGRQTTKLNTEAAQCSLFRRVLVLHTVF